MHGQNHAVHPDKTERAMQLVDEMFYWIMFFAGYNPL